MTEEQLNQVWKHVLEEIEVHYTPAVFKTWFKYSKLLQVNNSTAEVAVDNKFTQNIIKKFAE